MLEAPEGHEWSSEKIAKPTIPTLSRGSTREIIKVVSRPDLHQNALSSLSSRRLVDEERQTLIGNSLENQSRKVEESNTEKRR